MAKRIISRAAAKAKRLKFYFTGKPCVRGHTARRFLSGDCTKCRSFRGRRYWIKNKDQISAQRRKPSARVGIRFSKRLYYWKHRATLLAGRRTRKGRAKRADYDKRYRTLNKERIARVKRAWRKKNSRKLVLYLRKYYRRREPTLTLAQKRKRRELQAAWHRRNRNSILARAARWRKRNLLGIARKHHDWYLKNKERIVARRRERRRANPEAATIERMARRMAQGRSTPMQIAAILLKQNHRCANPYCRADLRKVDRHLDHKTPVSRGGTNWPRNLQWLCRRCNMEKMSKNMSEWRRFIKRRACISIAS
jgi:HNH endonuclease